MYDNRREGWILGGNYLADHPEKKRLKDKPTKAEIEAAKKEGKTVDMRLYAAKYTDNTQGLVECGWSPEAFEVQKDILGQVRDAHNDHWDRIQKLEAGFLPILQKEERVAVEKATKKRKVDPLAELVVNEFSDDEDDFAEV